MTFDIAVVGAGPAGAVAAYEAASAGARVLLLDRAEPPRYKCCGGGLIGVSTRHAPVDLAPLVRDEVHRITFTKDGRQRFTRSSRGGPVFRLVMRADFDAALVSRAVAAGAVLRTGVPVTGVSGSGVRLADGSAVAAGAVVGADGSGGRCGAYAGVRLDQVDVGLEGEFPAVPGWAGRVLVDWGPVPGSYGWVFPKGDLLTVGVIGPRSDGAAMRAYYDAFVARLGLGAPRHFSGHLTRCRTPDSPLWRDRVLVAGDAAGLLEPWTREGISFALRSGALAGRAAAALAAGDPGALPAYAAAVHAELEPEMAAGRRFLAAFRRNRQVFHGFLGGVPGGWRLFTRLVSGDTSLAEQVEKLPVRAILRSLGA